MCAIDRCKNGPKTHGQHQSSKNLEKATVKQIPGPVFEMRRQTFSKITTSLHDTFTTATVLLQPPFRPGRPAGAGSHPVRSTWNEGLFRPTVRFFHRCDRPSKGDERPMTDVVNDVTDMTDMQG